MMASPPTATCQVLNERPQPLQRPGRAAWRRAAGVQEIASVGVLKSSDHQRKACGLVPK